MILSGFTIGHRRSPGKSLLGGIVSVAVGLGCLVAGGWQYLRVSRASAWPTTTGKIESSQVTSSRGRKGRTKYHCHVSYVFEAGGKSMRGNTLAVGGEPTTSSGANARLAKYPAGAPCTVHYDPANPEDSCLELGDQGAAWILFGIGFLLILIGGIQAGRMFLP